jgi:hypothetical protein
MSRVTNPYKVGTPRHQAWELGVTSTSRINPYKPNTPRHDAWQRGCKADICDRTDQD